MIKIWFTSQYKENFTLFTQEVMFGMNVLLICFSLEFLLSYFIVIKFLPVIQFYEMYERK